MDGAAFRLHLWPKTWSSGTKHLFIFFIRQTAGAREDGWLQTSPFRVWKRDRKQMSYVYLQKSDPCQVSTGQRWQLKRGSSPAQIIQQEGESDLCLLLDSFICHKKSNWWLREMLNKRRFPTLNGAELESHQRETKRHLWKYFIIWFFSPRWTKWSTLLQKQRVMAFTTHTARVSAVLKLLLCCRQQLNCLQRARGRRARLTIPQGLD